MPSSIVAPEGQLSRRDRFRAFMKAFNPAAPALEMINAGLVCEDLHDFLFRKLAGRADLEPGSQQLLVGGVGAGKTTELLLARRVLLGQGNVLPLYLDISAETDLAGLNVGSLAASFGLHLGRTVLDDPALCPLADTKVDELKATFNKIIEYGYGKQLRRKVDTADAIGFFLQSRFVTEQVAGKLKPLLGGDIREIRRLLEEFLKVARGVGRDVVVIFDGLDRLLDPTKLFSVVDQDLRLLRELKVSVIVTAPLSVLLGVGIGQSISDYFDRVHHLTVVPSEASNTSLLSVLEKRNVSNMLNPGLAFSICNYSGGVLRDLISLARDAGEEAYVSDHDPISFSDIEKVAHQLGTGYLRGLGPESIQTLLKLESTKSIDLSQPANVELLLTRRVLEYSSTDFRVHPALLSVIPRPEPKRA